MKKGFEKRGNMERSLLLFLALILLGSAGVALFLNFYFAAYQNPYIRLEVFDLSQGWQYETPGTELTALDSLRSGPKLKGGETLTLYRTLDTALPKAAILIRANHQRVSVSLEGVPLYSDPVLEPGANPGIALHYISLPENYPGKRLKIELTSPYGLYAGRTSPILLGTQPALEAYALSASMRPLIMLAVFLALGIPVSVVIFTQRMGTMVRGEHLTLGAFGIIWALYYVCTEYFVLQFLTPSQMSAFSLGLYFLLPVPLTLFFYFSFEQYQKQMLPAVILHAGFAAAALALQLTGLVDLPRLVNLSNISLAGLLYTLVLTVLEALKKNRIMMLSAPFFAAAYSSMLYNFYVFYTRHSAAAYSYRDVYFLLVLAVFVYSVWYFFRQVTRQKRENELLSLQKRLAQDSYEYIKTHLRETAALKHDLKSHLLALRTYLEYGRIGEALDYLARYTGQSAAVTEAVYSEHILMNAVAGSLYQRAGAQGIKTELSLKAVPLHIADPDMYSLLSNLANNALEACMSMPPEAERFISLHVTRREPYFIISCKNSRSGDIISMEGKIQTTKAGEGHGYGLWTVERIVEAYDGMINIEYDGNTFTVTAALKDK